MKKLILCLVLMAPVSYAHAKKRWKIRVGRHEIKMDVPKPVHVIVAGPAEMQKKQFQTAAQIYQKNLDTVKTVGRVSACLYSMCMSEVHREEELKRERRERDRQIKEYRDGQLEAYKNQQNERLITLMQQELTELRKDLVTVDRSSELLENRRNAATALAVALDAEEVLRKELREIGEQLKKPEGATMQLATTFAAAVQQDAQQASQRLTEGLIKVHEETQREFSELAGEILRGLDDGTLAQLKAWKAQEASLRAQELEALNNRKQLTLERIKYLECELKKAGVAA